MGVKFLVFFEQPSYFLEQFSYSLLFSWRMFSCPVPVVSGCITFDMFYISTQQISYFCGQWKVGDVPSDA
jgi:hypothetical protein